jgi:hypothetical protein
VTAYRKIDEVTLQASSSLADAEAQWGAPRLRRIFNFRARQVISIYERGGTQDFQIPDGHYSSKTGYTAAVTSAMQVQNFRDIEGDGEIAAMHAELVRLGGSPPALDDILPRLAKKPGLRS